MSDQIKPTFSSSVQKTGDSFEERSALVFHTSVGDSNTEMAERFIDTKKLYPSGSISPYITTVFSLLTEATEKIEDALSALQNNDLIASDDAIHHFLSVFPELFCCRSIGDGFAALITAIFHSIKNNGSDKILTHEQLAVIRFTLNKLNDEPFINFSDALDLIMNIEEKDFIVEPKHLHHISEMLDE